MFHVSRMIKVIWSVARVSACATLLTPDCSPNDSRGASETLMSCSAAHYIHMVLYSCHSSSIQCVVFTWQVIWTLGSFLLTKKHLRPNHVIRQTCYNVVLLLLVFILCSILDGNLIATTQSSVTNTIFVHASLNYRIIMEILSSLVKINSSIYAFLIFAVIKEQRRKEMHAVIFVNGAPLRISAFRRFLWSAFTSNTI